MCYVTVDSKDVFELGSFLKDFSFLRPSGFLGSVDWYLVTDVSERSIGPIVKGQSIQGKCRAIPKRR